MADVRVGVTRWDGDHQVEPGQRGNAEFGAHWLAIDGRVVLDCSADDLLVSVSYEASDDGFGMVTVKLIAGSFATVDMRRKPLSTRLRERLGPKRRLR